MRVAIIGAGPSGLSQLCAFQSAASKGATIPEVVCFEKQCALGGHWNFTMRTGLDQYGEPVHSSMYRHLWSNGPKECLEYPNYTFEEHFGRPIASFPPRSVLFDYLNGRAEKAGVKDMIRFGTCVRQVRFCTDTSTFTVTVEDLDKKHVYSEVFDYVVVAIGHFSTPNVPKFEGLDSFPGLTIHAHDFRDARDFTGKNLLVIGSSYSAEDIALQANKFGSRSVTISYRSGAMGFSWPDGIKEVPLLTRMNGRTAHFNDGSTEEEIDVIILCTGYRHYFPFLDDDLRLETENCLYPPKLYQGIFWEPNPKLMYLGMQDQYYTFTMFDAQAWYARDVMQGLIKLPDRERMAEHTLEKQQLQDELISDEDKIRFQGEYTRVLIDATDYPSIDIDGVNEAFVRWEHQKQEGITTYRDHAFRSLITGTPSPLHHTSWLQAMDDSLDTFLQDKQKVDPKT